MLKRRLQFSIRLLLVCITLAAIAFTLLMIRPKPQVEILIAEDAVSVDGRLASFDTLMAVVEKERSWRERWFVEPTVTLRADEETAMSKVQLAIQACQSAGIEEFSLRQRTNGTNPK